MKTYLEINEQLTAEEQQVKQAQSIRIEVVDKDDAISKLSVYEPAFKGLNYIKQVHYCKHEDGGECVVEAL